MLGRKKYAQKMTSSKGMPRTTWISAATGQRSRRQGLRRASPSSKPSGKLSTSARLASNTVSARPPSGPSG